MERSTPLQVVFYMTPGGHEPVREWLRSLQKNEKKKIGEDVKTVQFGWPIGMPVVEKLDRDLWEVRTKLRNKISRVIVTVYENQIVLLHGFIKKTQKTPQHEILIARKRMKEVLQKSSIQKEVLHIFLLKEDYSGNLFLPSGLMVHWRYRPSF